MNLQPAALLMTLAMLPNAWADLELESDLQQLINDYYYAIGENRMEQALSLYHDASPETSRTKRALFDGQSAYLQRTMTLSFDLVQHDSKHTLARAAHRHLRIVGIKFMESFTEAEYEFRRHGNEWKIWSSKEQRISRRAFSSAL